MWCVLRGKPTSPCNESPVADRAYQEEPLGFAARETVVVKNKPSTIKGEWMAVRNECLIRGLKDLLTTNPVFGAATTPCGDGPDHSKGASQQQLKCSGGSRSA